MINMSEVAKALQDHLNQHPDMTFVRDEVKRGAVINTDPNRTPFVGIYRGPVNYEPRTLGSSKMFTATPKLRVIVQATHLRSEEECETLLEEYLEKTVNAILDDTTIGGTIDIITGFTIEYAYLESERSTLYFQAAEITLNLEAKTQ